MTHARPSLLDPLKDRLAGLGDDVREAAVLRWRLAALELQADVQAARRLAMVLAVTAVAALSALPLLAVALAEMLDGWLALSRAGWLLVMAGLLLAGAALGAMLAWQRFRRQFTALQQTREELAEDARWLAEWLQTRPATGEPNGA